MRVLIDADACPVTRQAAAICRELGIPCLLFCDTAHRLEPDGAQTVICDKGADSVDFALVNRVRPGDLVVTQDYGLASMCLARGAAVLDQNGRQYTAENIDALLELRHAAARLRRAGGRTKGPHKRTERQNQSFCAEFRACLLTNRTE